MSHAPTAARPARLGGPLLTLLGGLLACVGAGLGPWLVATTTVDGSTASEQVGGWIEGVVPWTAGALALGLVVLTAGVVGLLRRRARWAGWIATLAGAAVVVLTLYLVLALFSQLVGETEADAVVLTPGWGIYSLGVGGVVAIIAGLWTALSRSGA